MTESIVCDGCQAVFYLADAPDIEIAGADDARDDVERYVCPDCGYIVHVTIAPTEDTDDES
jgi:predicted RNA-binding Zn-ribbon protein involved in translation (DUF1610 family)